tara:strand:- start:4 stop:1338 length:1335 start_codon:yes stop_codon:yes gene_type:complete
LNKISTKRLGDILNFKRGYDLPLSSREDGAIPVISSAGISGCHSEFKAEGEGVITGRYGTLGEVYYVEGKYWPHNTTLYVTDFKSNYPKYVYYLLKCLGNLKTSDKSAVPGINRNDLHEVRVPYIKGSRQIEIANILDNLDAKIEVNNKINAELEAMAKLIYDYWFVQFDFPFDFAQGKPDPKGEPYKSSGGKMVYNKELRREIPEGWEVNPFAAWIKNDKSGDWGKETEQGNYIKQVSCIRGADLNGLNGKGDVKSPTRFILEKNSHKFLDIGDFIIEISGGSPTQSTGRMAFITRETLERFDNPLICSNFCKAVTLKEERAIYNFAYEWNRLYDAGVLFGWEGKTSGIKNLLFESFVSNHKVVIPDSIIMEHFYDKAKPIHAQMQTNLKQNQKLSELRDWLLPMLMNGQVTISKDELGITNAEFRNDLGMVAEETQEYKYTK